MNYREVIELWKDKQIDTIEKLEEALSSFWIIFAYHSGMIENQNITYHNTREIFENGMVINYTGELRTLYEIQNQKLCYDFLKERIVAKEPISNSLILAIHRELTQGTYDEKRWSRGEMPGKFKIHDYVVANGQGALPEEVASEIEELCGELTEIHDKGENVLKAAAYLHCKFENIHPFADGNGRVGRTLMNYFLMTHDHPPLVVYNETKDQYYRALGHYDETGEINLFVDHMKSGLERTWERRRAREEKLENILEPD